MEVKIPRVVIAACLLGLVAGCSSLPRTVYVDREVPAKVPPELLQSYPCGADIVTNGDLLSAYANCLEANRKHEADKAAIRALGR